MPSGFRLGLITVLIAALGFAQELTRTLSGTVRDQNGNPVKGAVVEVEDQLTLRVRSFITQEDGACHFALLTTYTDYRVKARFKGQRSREKKITMFDSSKHPVINLTVPVE
jgi:Carboxypeptidase regulatory-like domain